MAPVSTRSSLVIDLVKVVMSKYPADWKAAELALATGANIRAVERALAKMTEAGLLEKRYHAYALSRNLVCNFLESRFALKQQISKDVMLQQLEDIRNGKNE